MENILKDLFLSFIIYRGVHMSWTVTAQMRLCKSKSKIHTSKLMHLKNKWTFIWLSSMSRNCKLSPSAPDQMLCSSGCDRRCEFNFWFRSQGNFLHLELKGHVPFDCFLEPLHTSFACSWHNARESTRIESWVINLSSQEEARSLSY